MKIITSLIYDLSWMDHINKTIVLARINGVYYVWIQDEEQEVLVDDVIRNSSPTKSIKIAKEIFDFYKTFLDRCYTDELYNENSEEH